MELAAEDGSVTEGWGECVALSEPSYSPEYVEGAQHVIEHHLLQQLRSASSLDAAGVGAALSKLHGHPMAKAAIEMAVLDAQLRSTATSFASYLGAARTTIPSGVSVGIHDSIDDLLNTVQGYVDDGYVRIKLKIEPAATSSTSPLCASSSAPTRLCRLMPIRPTAGPMDSICANLIRSTCC